MTAKFILSKPSPNEQSVRRVTLRNDFAHVACHGHRVIMRYGALSRKRGRERAANKVGCYYGSALFPPPSLPARRRRLLMVGATACQARGKRLRRRQALRRRYADRGARPRPWSDQDKAGCGCIRAPDFAIRPLCAAMHIPSVRARSPRSISARSSDTWDRASRSVREPP
jgi:hypothetical protein